MTTDNPAYRWQGLTPPYTTIVADPPWPPLNRPGDHAPRGRPDYSTMTVEDICGLPVQGLAMPDAYLWVWVTNGHMEHGYQVVRAWGFDPRNLVTWCKPGPGVGYHLRTNTEHVIFGMRGRHRAPPRAVASTWFTAPRAEHSVKPAAFADIVEQISPGPYLELFARAPRLGWDHWGYGYESDIA